MRQPRYTGRDQGKSGGYICATRSEAEQCTATTNKGGRDSMTTQATETSTREYGYTLWLRCSGEDDRPTDRLPITIMPAQPTERERTLDAACYITDLEARQGYHVERIENWSRCAACSGTGEQRVRPKGWRKRTPPPWFALKTVPCRTCAGVGDQAVDERIDR